MEPIDITCDNCGFVFYVVWNNADAQAGNRQVCYCPRCGSDELLEDLER